MGEALLFSQKNSANSGAKHKEQWLSIEDPSWVTVHNNITLPSNTSTSTLTLHVSSNNAPINQSYTIFNGLTRSINLTPNSIICIKNVFTTTATSSPYTQDYRYVYYYDSQYNQIGYSRHDFTNNNFSSRRVVTAYPCSSVMGNNSVAYEDHDILQLAGTKTTYGYDKGILVPEDGIVNIAIGIDKQAISSNLPMTCTTQYSYINFIEHFSEEEYEYHTTIKSLESSDSLKNTALAPYFNQISNSYIPTVEAVDEMPYSDTIFLYNGTLYSYRFYPSLYINSSSVRYKVYK